MTRSWVLLAGVLAACGPSVPPATFETFTIDFEEPDGGATELHPMERARFRVTYRGDLARDLELRATLTHVESGSSVTETIISPQSQDAASFNHRLSWLADHESLKRSGLFEVRLTATIHATKKNSPIWTAESSAIFVRSASRLDSVALTPLTPGAPTPYGTAQTVTVTGNDLWDDVKITVEDLDRAQPVPTLELTLPSAAPLPRLAAPWTLSAPALDHVGVFRLQLVATFGALVVRSEPFTVEVTHTIDSAVLKLRNAADVVRPAYNATERMDETKDFLLQVSGTNLAGREVKLDGEPAFVAPSDSFELVRAPDLRDFEDGKGTRRYDYVFHAGGTTRSASVTMRRWGFTGCGWVVNGMPASPSQVVADGTPVTMRATGWGFPDTTTFLFIKSHQAHFKIWERDYGQNNTNLPQPLVNNDDEVTNVDGDMRSSVSEAPWKAKFDEELEFLHLNRAELYFEVRMEDELCTAGEIVVPPPR